MLERINQAEPSQSPLNQASEVSPVDIAILTSSVGNISDLPRFSYRVRPPELMHETYLRRPAKGGCGDIESGRLLRRQKTPSRPGSLLLMAMEIRNRSVARPRRARVSFVLKVMCLLYNTFKENEYRPSNIAAIKPFLERCDRSSIMSESRNS